MARKFFDITLTVSQLCALRDAYPVLWKVNAYDNHRTGMNTCCFQLRKGQNYHTMYHLTGPALSLRQVAEAGLASKSRAARNGARAILNVVNY